MSCCSRANTQVFIDENTKLKLIKDFDKLKAGSDVSGQPFHIKWMLIDLKYAVIEHD